MDDREAQSYSTPPEAAPPPGETRAARESMEQGMPTLIAAVFAGVVVIAVVVLAIRYLL
jgi:hypothetical protein